MIFSAITGYSIAIVNVIFKRKKFFSLVLLIFMWILFGWNTSNGDYTIHLNKYYDSNQSILVEPVFSFLTSLFRNFGFSYSNFLTIMSCIFLVSLFILARKLVGKYYPFLLGLYFIFPLLFNIVIFRFSIGLIFSYWGIYLLLKTDKKVIWSILFLLVGGLTHFSLLILLILPICKLISKRKVVIITILVVVVEVIFIRGINLSILLNFQSNNILLQKVSYVLSNTRSFEFAEGRSLQVIGFYFVFLYIWYLNKLLSKETEVSRILFNMNTLILIMLPLMWINSDLYRTQITLLLFNYSLLINNYKNSSPKKFIVSNIFISVVSLFIAFLFLIVYILIYPVWFKDVFIAIFTNNYFW